MQNDENSYAVLDFRRKAFEFRPYVKSVSFIVPDDVLRKPYVEMKYSDSTAEKLFWISNCLRRDDEKAMIVLRPTGKNVIRGDCLIEIEDFPVTDFARNFRIERILEKGIRKMRVSVMARFGLQITDNLFFDVFNDTLCELRINCESPLLEQELGYNFPFILDAHVTSAVSH
jgi:hypothetical protein